MLVNYITFSLGLVILLALVFIVLQWLQIPTGSFIDWAIAVASFAWLLIIVTVPWNIHFEAKEALADAALSVERGIRVDEKQIEYVKIVQKRSLWVAIALHLSSALGLYILASAGISVVGYVSSGAALLVTALRPAISAYKYFSTRLVMIRQQFKYPHQDIVELCSRFNSLEEIVKKLDEQLNPNDPRSWVATVQRQIEAIRNDLTRVAAVQEELRSVNQAEHERLGREARQAIAQLTTDGQFLEHVREIIRFFKTA